MKTTRRAIMSGALASLIPATITSRTPDDAGHHVFTFKDWLTIKGNNREDANRLSAHPPETAWKEHANGGDLLWWAANAGMNQWDLLAATQACVEDSLTQARSFSPQIPEMVNALKNWQSGPCHAKGPSYVINCIPNTIWMEMAKLSQSHNYPAADEMVLWLAGSAGMVGNDDPNTWNAGGHFSCTLTMASRAVDGISPELIARRHAEIVRKMINTEAFDEVAWNTKVQIDRMNKAKGERGQS